MGSTVNSPLVRWAIRLVAIAAASLGIFWFFWLPNEANHMLLEIDRDTGRIEKLPRDVRVTEARDHLEKLARFERVSRLSVDYYMIMAANERMANDQQRAIDLYSLALTIDRRPELYLWRGRTYFDMGRYDAGIADLYTAVRYNKYLIYAVPDDLVKHIQGKVYPGAAIPPRPRWLGDW